MKSESSISVDEFQDYVKTKRDELFLSSYERAYKCFLELEFDKKEPIFFKENASDVVIEMRKRCWADFMQEEQEFTIKMLKHLIPYANISQNLSIEENIEKYIEAFPEHIYMLNLSNTQSRRSRAGKEFEHILELILMGANVSLASQGNIGKELFVTKGLGKLVDFVTPGVTEFEINKRNTVLISAKTTLRERWQEVPEEMGRTGASEMFLATLDDKVTKNVLDTLYESNIQLTTTKQNKEENYKGNNRILTFEELIQICTDIENRWNACDYTAINIATRNEQILIERSKHANHDFVLKYFDKLLDLKK